MNSPVKTYVLNMHGIKCPDFGYSLRQFVRSTGIPPGAEITIHSDAHNSPNDVRKLCDFGGHNFVSASNTSGSYTFVIRKGE